MVLNALKNGAKRMMKSIKIRCNGINKTLPNHETHDPKGAKWASKSGVLGAKSAYLGMKN